MYVFRRDGSNREMKGVQSTDPRERFTEKSPGYIQEMY